MNTFEVFVSFGESIFLTELLVQTIVHLTCQNKCFLF